MSWQAITIYSVVALFGFPAAFRWLGIRNTTALALVIAWMVGEIVSAKTGNPLPITTYAVTDPLVITAICIRATIREGCSTYPTFREQMRCFWDALTAFDRLIIGLFLFGAWPIYAAYLAGLHPYYTWMLLWAITIAQLMLAGAEALLDWRKARGSRHPTLNSDNIIPFAPAYARKRIGAEPISTRSDTLFLVVEKAGDG